MHVEPARGTVGQVETVELSYFDRTIVGPPDHIIAERDRLGLDTRDEVWDGVYHMAPQPMPKHQLLVIRLAASWIPLAQEAGLIVCHELSLFPPTGPTRSQYRVPDIVVFDEAVLDIGAGVVGAARLVVEVRSPGDESYEKLPYFDEIGVGEVLIIERDGKAVRRWVRREGGPLAEVGPDGEGWHRLDALPVALRGADDALAVAIGGEVTVL